jgi:hypothetical protein
MTRLQLGLDSWIAEEAVHAYGLAALPTWREGMAEMRARGTPQSG